MKVFTIQRVRKRDKLTNEFVFKHDLTAAERFGEIVELLSPTATPYSPGVVEELRAKLANYDGRTDWILCTGSPVLIGWAVAIAADNSESGHVKLLQWSGADENYHPFEARLFPDCSKEQ